MISDLIHITNSYMIHCWYENTDNTRLEKWRQTMQM